MTASTSSQMPPPPKRRDLADFFKPYGQTTTTIPLKRSSSGSGNESVKTVRRYIPKTPVKTVTFKDLTPSSGKTQFYSPLSQSALPIRSPKPKPSPSPNKSRQPTLLDELVRASPKEFKPTNSTSFTFSDVSDRSQKIFEGGKVVAVRDSEDDTDSLESLEDIFGRRKEITVSSDSSPPEDLESERLKTLSIFTHGRSLPKVGKDKLRALHAKERATKFDLSVVLDDHFGDVEAEESIAKMRVGLGGTNDTDSSDDLDKALLASVVRSKDADQDDVDRLLHAVERTEALSGDKKFSFFRVDTQLKSKSQRRNTFPKSAIPDELWASGDAEARNRSYLSGYMAELASAGFLDDTVLKWTLEQVIQEPQYDLREAYVQCLQLSSAAWTRLNVSASDVQSCFTSLGADTDCLRDGSSIEPKYQPVVEVSKHDYKQLYSVLDMFYAISQDMDFPALSKLVSIVLRLVLDGSVMSDQNICIAAESLIEKLLSLPDEEARNHVYQRFLSDATEHLHDPQLQVQLLSYILPTTLEASELRKTLADTFLLGLETIDPKTQSSSASIQDFSKYISSSPHFTITRHANSSPVDYVTLTAQTQILNVAISSGEIPSKSAYSRATLTVPSRTKASSEEIQFNISVDLLADRLHNLFVSIKDTGASHMRRTEAKDALQALYFRLLFSVRSKARKKKHVFDANGDMKAGSHKGRWVSGEEWREKERGGEFMKKFLKRREGG